MNQEQNNNQFENNNINNQTLDNETDIFNQEQNISQGFVSQPLDNSSSSIVNEPQSFDNNISPIDNNTLPQPDSTTIQGMNPQPIFDNNQKKSKGKLFIIIAIILVIAAGVGAYFMFGPKGSGKGTGSGGNEKNTDIYTFSNSTATDNIAIPLQKTKGFYVVKFNGKGLGEKFTKEYKKMEDQNDYAFYNDAVSIISFYNTASDPLTETYGIWDFGFIDISVDKYDERYINGEVSGTSYSTIDQKDNNYLVKKTNEYGTKYHIVIPYEEDMIQLYLYLDTEEKAKDFYNKFLTDAEICYISMNEKRELSKAVKSPNSKETVDISNWTFVNDMIRQFYYDRGLKFKNSIFISSFNTTNRGLKGGDSIYFDPVYELDGEDYTAGFTIEYYGDEYTKKEKDEAIDLDMFDESYLLTSRGKANMIMKMKGKNKYYRMETGLEYNSDGDKEFKDKHVKNINTIMNQLFY